MIESRQLERGGRTDIKCSRDAILDKAKSASCKIQVESVEKEVRILIEVVRCKRASSFCKVVDPLLHGCL